MQLLFIYGAPGTGKLTVAQEVSRLTNFKVLHNHLAQDFVLAVYEWEHPERKRLARKFRLELIESAAKNNINLILTYAAVGEGYNDFLDDIIAILKRNNATLHLVKLMCDREELMKRVELPSRKKFLKLHTKEQLEKKLNEIDYTQVYPQQESIVINNTNKSPEEVADEIINIL